MQERKILEYLEDLAEKLGVEIVYGKLAEEDFRARGGLCKVKGVHKIFLDRSSTVGDRIETLARALSSFDMEEVYILPYIREILHKAQRSS
jgi:hypothetical protein